MNHKDYNIINLEYKGVKGPWELGDENNASCDINAGDTVISFDRRGRFGEEYIIERDEMLATADLIIAAPDLLEACDDLLQYWLGTYGESYVTEAAQAAISKAVGRPYKEIAEAKTDYINESINSFDLLNNKLQHACNLMNQMYECLYNMDNPMDLSDVEAFIRENDKTPKPEKQDDSDLELPF
jgi:hypothetical protein